MSYIKRRQVIDTLFYLPALLSLLFYFAAGDKASGMVLMVANVIGIALLIILSDKKLSRQLIAISVVFLLYLFITPEAEGSRMYLSTVLYTCVLLVYFSVYSYNIDNYKQIERLDKLVGWFALTLIVGQLLTIDNPMQFIRTDYDSVTEDALEKKGFMISHAFGYYLASFLMYYAYRKKVFYMVILTILCFLFSRRTVVLMCGIGWLYYINEKYGWKVVMLALGAAASIVVTYLSATAYFGEFAFSLDPSDSAAAAYTSGRTRFWGSFLYFKLMTGQMNLQEYLFGFGPASSREFNETYSGLKVWMHNDIVDILFCMGAIGLAIYLYCVTKACKRMGLHFTLFLLLAANLNGFMLYQIYPVVYLFAIINGIKKCEKK